jgi:hypothetical protein
MEYYKWPDGLGNYFDVESFEGQYFYFHRCYINMKMLIIPVQNYFYWSRQSIHI